MRSSNSGNWEVFDQKYKWESSKWDGQPVRPSDPKCRKQLAFGNLSNLPIPSSVNSDPTENHKRKLSPSSNTNPISKKQNRHSGVENKPTAMDVSTPRPLTPRIQRKGSLRSQLNFSPSPKNSHSVILMSLAPVLESCESSEPQIKKRPVKEPKCFTFSEEHIALSKRDELNVKRMAYKKAVREFIQKSDALLERDEPGYIREKQAMISNLSDQQRAQMIADIYKKYPEYACNDQETATKMELACTPRF